MLSRHVHTIFNRYLSTARTRGWLGPSQRTSRPPSTGFVLLNWLLLLAVLVAAGVKAYLPLRTEINVEAERNKLPADAIEWIQEQRPTGPMFNSYNWGGYLIWRLWPDYLVFVDGRTDLFGDELLSQYLQVHFARPGFQKVLDDYGVNFVLTETAGFTANFLALDEAWTLAYTDQVAAIYVRGAE